MIDTKKQIDASNGMEIAVIETGGKQYKVSKGDIVTIEKLSDTAKEGEKVTFDKVLLTDSGTDTVVGSPYITNAKVTGTITEIGRAPKVLVVKFKQKSKYLKRNGHRQPFVKVKIETL